MIEFFKQLPLGAQIVVVIIIIIAIIVLLNFIKKEIKKRRDFELVENNTANATDASGANVNFNIGAAIAGLYEAFHGSIFGEDEIAAMQIISSTPKALIPKLKEDYNKKYGEVLTVDCLNYLTSAQYSQIKAHLE